jgi:hypothetical protein
MKECMAFLAGIVLVSSAMFTQSNNQKFAPVDMRSWLQSSRPLVQSKMLFYSDGQFAYRLTIQESTQRPALQWVVPQHQSFGIMGVLKDGSLLQDTNPRIWIGDITLRVYGEDESLTRNWKDVTIVMEQLQQ